jgi:hypothetical protein
MGGREFFQSMFFLPGGDGIHAETWTGQQIPGLSRKNRAFGEQRCCFLSRNNIKYTSIGGNDAQVEQYGGWE